jgi:hypothetical protein
MSVGFYLKRLRQKGHPPPALFSECSGRAMFYHFHGLAGQRLHGMTEGLNQDMI